MFPRALLTALVSAAMVTTGGVAADTNHDGFETILLPIAFRPGVEVRGAFGTVWQGQVWLTNRSRGPINIQQWYGCGSDDCLAFYPAAYAGLLTKPVDDLPEPGALLTPTADDAQLLTFSNRIFEVTRHAQPQGIEVPVVREGNFISGSTVLLGIPVAGVRSALRVYDPRRVAGASFRIEAVAPDGTVLGATDLTTMFSLFGPHQWDPIRPGFAAIYDLAAAFPGVTGLDYFHVRITPITQGVEFWAMVSVTDNDTQQVLIIAPQ